MRNLLCVGILAAVAVPAAAQDMNLSQILIPGEEWREVPAECKSAAGLAGDGRGNIYVADGKQVWRIDRDGKASLFAKTDGAVHGVAVGPDGKVFATEPGRKCILLLDADGKEQGRSEGDAVEDLVVTKNGAIYATIDGDHSIYLFRNGKKRKVGEFAPTPWSSSGSLALWDDGGTLVVGDAGDRYLYAFRVRQDGDLDARDRYYPLFARRNRLSPLRPSVDAMTSPSIPFWEPSGNAGLALDAVGRVYATSKEGVQMFDPTGRLSGIMAAPAREELGGVAFGGAELDRLYVACGGKVYVRKMLAKGVRVMEQKRP
jgi:gluconolactonase